MSGALQTVHLRRDRAPGLKHQLVSGVLDIARGQRKGCLQLGGQVSVYADSRMCENDGGNNGCDSGTVAVRVAGTSGSGNGCGERNGCVVVNDYSELAAVVFGRVHRGDGGSSKRGNSISSSDESGMCGSGGVPVQVVEAVAGLPGPDAVHGAAAGRFRWLSRVITRR